MSEITFIVTEEPDGGFCAYAVRPDGKGRIFTEGDTREELTANVREAVDVSFDEGEEQPKLIHLHFVRDEVIFR